MLPSMSASASAVEESESESSQLNLRRFFRGTIVGFSESGSRARRQEQCSVTRERVGEECPLVERWCPEADPEERGRIGRAQAEWPLW